MSASKGITREDATDHLGGVDGRGNTSVQQEQSRTAGGDGHDHPVDHPQGDARREVAMPYILRNTRPSVVHIPDAGLRIEPGQRVTVAALSPQLAQLSALGVVAITSTALAPVPQAGIRDVQG